MNTCTKTTALLAALAVITLNLNPVFAAEKPAAPASGEYPIGWPALERMDLLPLLPPIGTQTKQFISYDTSGGNASGFSFFRRYEQDGEWVFFDEIGPGFLPRLQMNVWKRGAVVDNDGLRIRFRFDNEKEPRIDIPFNEFFGCAGKYTEPWTPPLAHWEKKFACLYYPFSFAKRLQISAYHPSIRNAGASWYQFTYLKFPSATSVTTWPGRDLDTSTIRRQWKDVGQDPKPVAGGRTVGQTVALKAGDAVMILDEKGAGTIQRLNISMKPWNKETFYKTRVRVTWDDQAEAMIDVPVGCLLGGGGDAFLDVSGRKLSTLMFGFDGTTGQGYSYWPMPFWKRARIEVVNESAADLESLTFTAVVDSSAAAQYPQDRAGYFAVTRSRDDASIDDYHVRAFERRGYGKLMGVMMYSKNFAEDGDEFTYIDGSKTPQIHGDGTEDDHNQGWAGHGIQGPVWGALFNGVNGAYRLYLSDPYVFYNRIRKTYEIINEAEPRTDFICWAYLGQPGVGNLSLTDTLDVGDPGSEERHQWKVTGEKWSGLTKASYDAYSRGDPYPSEDHGRSFTNSIQFEARVDPDNQGVRLRRRLNRHLANNQLARVFVDDQEIPDTPWYFCDLPTPEKTAFADTDFEIPARYTRNKKQITVRIEHVRAEPDNANNIYLVEVWCYGHRPLPSEPTSSPFGLRAVEDPPGKITVRWQPGGGNPATGYTIERKALNEPDFMPLAKTGAADTVFGDKTARACVSYQYRVRGESGAGSSDWKTMSLPFFLLPPEVNLLKDAVASSSSLWEKVETYSAAKANDGDLTTRWNSAVGHTTNEWLAFDLPKPKRINAVSVHQETMANRARITECRLQVRVNGEWTEVWGARDIPRGDIFCCRFEPVTTDGLRVWIAKTTGGSPSIKEIEAYNCKEDENR